MKPYYQTDLGTLYHGDALDVLKGLPEESVDAVLTDPPYGLGFMGVKWDTYRESKGRPPSQKHTFDQVGGNSHARKPGGQERIRAKENRKYQKAMREHFDEILRVAKPGAHLLAFGGTRTFHRLTCAIEDTGWEIRDTIMWVYGSGFPKSLDVSKAIDRAAGVERETVGQKMGMTPSRSNGAATFRDDAWIPEAKYIEQTAPATPEAKEWEGWGTALKPAYEPIIVARKPLDGTVAENVLKHGTGALNIDECRVPHKTINGGNLAQNPHLRGSKNRAAPVATGFGKEGDETELTNQQGRFPANLIHDGSDEVVGLFPETASHGDGGFTRHKANQDGPASMKVAEGYTEGFYGDTGSAARFFYCAKASPSERGKGNTHPTVKPLTLMQYLLKLCSRRGQVILDPFLGSGTTALACEKLGRKWIGIDNTETYCQMAVDRIGRETAQGRLFG